MPEVVFTQTLVSPVQQNGQAVGRSTLGLTPELGRLQVSAAMNADKDAPEPMEDETTTQEPSTEESTTPESKDSKAESTHNEEDPDEDPLQQLEREAAKWKEVSLRTAAEMENLRKRTTREREEAVRYANARLLEELLPVIDNFEMGMQAAAEDTKSMIYIGMDMVRKQLTEFLSSQGVEEVTTDGLFDPNLHEAVAQEDCAEGEEGRILKVTRRGFKLQDRLLRPASVVVSKRPNEDRKPDEAGSKEAQES